MTALLREYGKPTFFVTVTCNLQWVEIQRELKPGQCPYDRPDLITRVFHEKLTAIRKVLQTQFGTCVAIGNSIEFQKRGAPHTHLIIWIKDFEQTVTNIDNVISAEIPSDENSSEFKLVKKMMIHGPCENNSNLTCNINGKCKYHYPRPFAEETIIGENAFPTYRRRSPENGGNTCMKYMYGKQVLVDNRNVVPYNFYLLETFDGHVNIEYVASVKTIKYIIKYQMKDRIW